MNLDILSIELIWYIFDYLSSYDLFFSVRNVNRRLNVVINSYSRHRLNFYSVPKLYFDLICRFICPQQVISLTLSEGNHAPGQLELFFSIFGGIKQFVNLQSFELQSFGRYSLIDSLLVDLHNLNHLSSLRLVVKSPMLVICSKSRLGRLFRLDIQLFDDRLVMPLNGLRHLTLSYCTFKQLGMIFSQAKQIISVNVKLEPDDDAPMNDKFDQIPSPPFSLTRLAIKISYYTLSMTDMEEFLSKMVHLKDLKMEGHGNIDLVDGLKWQALVSHLIMFNFDWKISSQINNDLLETFHSNFWLKEKRWFVIYDKRESHLFTTPLFASRKVNFPLSTVSYHSFLPSIDQIASEYVENLSIQDSTVSPTHHYQRVRSLRIDCINVLLSFETLSSIVNLTTVEHLLINTTSPLLAMIGHFLTAMPSLHRLTIDDSDRLLYFDPKPVFKQIRTLELTYKNDQRSLKSPVDISNLCRLFSHVQYLTMRINSFEDMTNIINELKYLSYVNFDMNYFCDTSSIFDLTNQWFASNTRPRRMFNKNNYTYRFSLDSTISIWI